MDTAGTASGRSCSVADAADRGPTQGRAPVRRSVPCPSSRHPVTFRHFPGRGLTNEELLCQGDLVGPYLPRHRRS
jgi:hypothetical protein